VCKTFNGASLKIKTVVYLRVNLEMAILYNKFNNIGLNFINECFLSLDHALLTPAVSQQARRHGCYMDNTAKIKL
jgi:hypothetical protein